MMIKSRFTFSLMFLHPLLVLAFGWVLPALILYIAFDDENYTLIIPGLLMFAAGIYLLQYYVRKTTRVLISEEGVTFVRLLGNYHLDWAAVTKIRIGVKGREDLRWLGQAEDCIIINEGKKRHPIFLVKYRNAALLQRTFEHVKNALKKKHPLDLRRRIKKKRVTQVAHSIGFERYGTRFYRSINGIVVMGWFLLALYIYYEDPQRWGWAYFLWVMLVYFLPIYLYAAYQLHYFCLNDRYLVVKNHLVPGWKKVYALDEIKVVHLISPYRHSDGLKVIETDYESRKFLAGSLYKKDWKRLRTDLKRRGISVKNRTGSPYP